MGAAPSSASVPALIEQLITVCARPGDIVLTAETGDELTTDTPARVGLLILAVTDAHLVPLPQAAALLRPDGRLALLTRADRESPEFTDPGPTLIRRARQYGLVYRQHIIALDPRTELHTDIWLFTAPGGEAR